MQIIFSQFLVPKIQSSFPAWWCWMFGIRALKGDNCKPSFSINDPLVTYPTSAFRPLICKTSLLLILFCGSKPRLFPLVTLISREVITDYQDLSWFRFRQIRFRQNCPQTVLLESLGQISLLLLRLFLVRVHFAPEILPHLLYGRLILPHVHLPFTHVIRLKGWLSDWSWACQLQWLSGDSVVKNLPAIAAYTSEEDSIPRLRRASGVGNGNPLQYSWPGKSHGRGVWRATVHGVTKSQT